MVLPHISDPGFLLKKCATVAAAACSVHIKMEKNADLKPASMLNNLVDESVGTMGDKAIKVEKISKANEDAAATAEDEVVIVEKKKDIREIIDLTGTEYDDDDEVNVVSKVPSDIKCHLSSSKNRNQLVYSPTSLSLPEGKCRQFTVVNMIQWMC